MRSSLASAAGELRQAEADLDSINQERQPAVLRHAQKSFARVTSGRYDRIRVDGSSDSLIVRGGDGVDIDATRLSTGATEQLYLAMRFGWKIPGHEFGG